MLEWRYEGKKSRNKFFCRCVLAMLFALLARRGQQPGKFLGWAIGLTAAPLPASVFGRAARSWICRGKNIAFEYRTTEGKSERRPDQVAELVHLKVDIIVADGTGPTLGAKKATSAIPIVMTSSSDPVGTGLIASLARPGGNVTGLTSVTGESGGKLLELLKEIVPRLTRVGIALPGPDSPASKLF